MPNPQQPEPRRNNKGAATPEDSRQLQAGQAGGGASGHPQERPAECVPGGVPVVTDTPLARPASAAATVMPEMTTVRPAGAMVRPIAVSPV
ncbi:hypothetical protein ACIP4Y_08905 [Streptomyces sp. NPDC088810]|uniref:hypothetical protein n=1 Tax=Streptomyces sp. NPDC088810 TaxID=3365904 RepID=UPI0037F559D6